MIVEKCLAPLRWIGRLVPGTGVVPILQQQWSLSDFPDAGAGVPRLNPVGIEHVWRDVPTVILDAKGEELPPRPAPDMEWCIVHRKWETPAEWSACDGELYRQGFRNIGGVILQVDPNPEDDET